MKQKISGVVTGHDWVKKKNDCQIIMEKDMLDGIKEVFGNL